MPTHIALLRAINVGGTGKLPMAELRALCESLGFTAVRTYIQSGNVVFKSRSAASKVKKALEGALEQRMGRRHAALLRTLDEMVALEAANPFPDADPKRVLVVFLDAAPKRDALDAVKVPGDEVLELRGRELFIHFPDGMGKSRLKVPFADVGTGRNLNTVRALIALARESP